MADVSGVRVGTVAWVASGATVVCALALRGWQWLGHELPVVPWLSVLPLGMLVALVLAAGWQVRRHTQHRFAAQRSAGQPVPPRRAGPGTMLSPQRARGALVAAQAAALGGGALVGWYLAIALLHLPNVDVVSVRGLVLRAVVSAVAAGVLAVAGLVAQAWCRLPPDEDDEDGPRGVSYV